MITMAVIGKIRRMHLRQGKSVREIVRLTSLSRNALRRHGSQASSGPGCQVGEGLQQQRDRHRLEQHGHVSISNALQTVGRGVPRDQQ